MVPAEVELKLDALLREVCSPLIKPVSRGTDEGAVYPV
jgi:hypothetical protein